MDVRFKMFKGVVRKILKNSPFDDLVLARLKLCKEYLLYRERMISKFVELYKIEDPQLLTILKEGATARGLLGYLTTVQDIIDESFICA